MSFNFYKSRKFNQSSGTGDFWDIVVLTASDDKQAEAYEMQLSMKLLDANVPCCCRYVVYADPPNNKAGSGGSTFHVLECLREDFGIDVLNTKRILLLSAGGYSQRLISASALGKLFTSIPLPYGKANEVMQIFELKLCLYLPLLKTMPPGIFLSSSDTIEVYALDEDSLINFDNGGFTALAHPSSIEVGRGHGVFVLQRTLSDPSVNSKPSLMAQVSRVLQKPSEKLMIHENCISRSLTSEGEIIQEFVYTDSCYFFDASISKLLLRFYDANKPISCEVCAYGDFMRPLGSDPTISYTEGDDEISRVRRLLYDLLKGTPLDIIKLTDSVFYHLGTMSEYLEHMTHKTSLSDSLNFTSSVFNRGVSAAHLTGTVMHCWIDSLRFELGKDCVLEYSRIGSHVTIEDNCIISNCTLPYGTRVPSDTFVHTLVVNRSELEGVACGNDEGYVCVLLDTRDDMKKCFERCEDLLWCKKKLSDKFGDLNEIFDEDCKQKNLWNARLFTVHESMSKALTHSLSTLNTDAVRSNDTSQYVSIGQAVKAKNAKFMLNYRRLLYQDILESLS